MMVIPKFVRSLGWDPGHHEELRNGPEDIVSYMESGFRVLEKFGIFSVKYRNDSRRFQKVPKWDPLP